MLNKTRKQTRDADGGQTLVRIRTGILLSTVSTPDRQFCCGNLMIIPTVDRVSSSPITSLRVMLGGYKMISGHIQQQSQQRVKDEPSHITNISKDVSCSSHPLNFSRNSQKVTKCHLHYIWGRNVPVLVTGGKEMRWTLRIHQKEWEENFICRYTLSLHSKISSKNRNLCKTRATVSEWVSACIENVLVKWYIKILNTKYFHVS